MSTSKQERERRFDEQFLDCRAEKLVRNRPYFWKQVWDGGDQMVDNSDPDKIKAFIEEEIAKALQQVRDEIKNRDDLVVNVMGRAIVNEILALPSLSTKEEPR